MRIKELYNTSSGFSFKSQEFLSQGIPLIRIGDLKDNVITIDDKTAFLPENYTRKYSKFVIKKNDILIAMSGATIGKFAIYENDNPALLNQRVAVFRSVENSTLMQRYLFYYLFTANKHIRTLATSSAIENITLSELQNLEIYIPKDKINLERIVSILDRTQNLIQKRQQTIEILDELVKAVFWDMFGDPYLNNKNWEIVNVDNVVENINAGKSVSGIHRKLSDNEIAVLKVSAVTKGFFNPEEYKVVNKEKIKKPIITLKRGDILFTRANTMDLVAATCTVDKDYPYLFLPDKIWKIQLKDNLVKPNYFKMVLSNNGYRKALALKATGSSGSMVNISQEKLKNNNFPLASFRLQSQFEEFVTLVDKLKVLLKDSLESNQILFQSFIQKAFKGELDFEKAKILEDILPNLKLEELLSDLKLLKSFLDKLQKQDFKTGSNYKLAQNLLFQLLDNKKSGVFQQCDVETENLEIKHEAS